MSACTVLLPNEAEDECTIPQCRILLVEDDIALRKLFASYLRQWGFDVLTSATDAEALHLTAEQAPDLIVVDVNLFGSYRFEVARRLRATTAIPMLMLIDRAEEVDLLADFGAGVDDFLTRPFRPRELVVRVRTLMRRLAATSLAAVVPDDTLRIGDIVIQPWLREARRDGVPLALTAKEFDLLAFLAAHPTQVFTRRQLLQQVWHYEVGNLNTVTVQMSRLRAKVDLGRSKPPHLRTVRGTGYTFAP